MTQILHPISVLLVLNILQVVRKLQQGLDGVSKRQAGFTLRESDMALRTAIEHWYLDFVLS